MKLVSLVKATDDGLLFCEKCGSEVKCDKCGDMPTYCPRCGRWLDYSEFDEPAAAAAAARMGGRKMLLCEVLSLFIEGQYDAVIIEAEDGRPIYSGSIICARLDEADLAREVAGLSVSPAFSIEGAATGAALHIKTRKALEPVPLEVKNIAAGSVLPTGEVKHRDEFIIIEHAPRRDGSVPTRLVPLESLPRWEALNYRPVGRGIVEVPLYMVRENLVKTAEEGAEHKKAERVARCMIEACQKVAAEFGVDEEAGK